MKKLKNEELNRLSTEEFKTAQKVPLAIVLDDVRSAYNVGSVFRTADAFRISMIHLCGISARPPHKDIHKTALGADESVDWKYFPDVRDSFTELKEQGYAIYAFEQTDNSILLQDFKPEPGKKLALIFGHEVFGVKEELLGLIDGCVEIPQFGTKHSLNISVSAGIAIWDIFSKLYPEGF
jgi:23S rRNA (guanosine2251-2'-O)-methyltransferase